MSASSPFSKSVRAREAAAFSVGEILRRLGAKPSKGLSSGEAEERRQLHGTNEFIIKEDDPLWKKYLNQVSFFKWWFGVHYLVVSSFEVQRSPDLAPAGVCIHQCVYQAV